MNFDIAQKEMMESHGRGESKKYYYKKVVKFKEIDRSRTIIREEFSSITLGAIKRSYTQIPSTFLSLLIMIIT